ncbi:MAG TPA: DNRLRE domain-containing protein, partial [Actinomycetota bacterium]|nr:DNRLRE domain-containing protein [Actinomycetota bacterium]
MRASVEFVARYGPAGRAAARARGRRPRRTPALVAVAALLAGGLTVVPVAPRRAVAQDARRTPLATLQAPSAVTTQADDGALRTRLFAAPVQFEASDGVWRSIDSALVATDEDGFDFTNDANALDVLLDSHADGRLLRLEDGGREYSFVLEGAARSPGAAAGNRIVYRDVFEDADLRYDVLADGVKETLVLAGDAAPARYEFALVVPDPGAVDVQERPDGSWALTYDRDDAAALVLHRPVVVDADGVAGPADLDVARAGDRFAVSLSVAERWLRDPARAWPVELDPTVTVQAPNESTDDAVLDWACQSCPATTPGRLSIGTDAAARYRAALAFDLSGVPAGSAVTSARLKLFHDGTCVASSCAGAHTIDVHRMSAPWTTGSAPQDVAFDATALASDTLTSGSAPRWLSWDLTAAVQSWLAGSTPNHGVLVKRSDDSAASQSGPKVPGRRFSDDPSLRPVLEITWTGSGSTLFEPKALHSNGAELSWSVASPPGGETFQAYEVHRVIGGGNFTPSPATLVATLGDRNVNAYRDTTAAAGATFTYKIVTRTSAGTHQSNRQTVALPALDASGRGRTTAMLQPAPDQGKATYLTGPAVVGSGDVCKNHGASAFLRVGASDVMRFRPLVWFDLRDVPHDADVSAATMKLYHPATNANVGIDVHRVTKAWKEGAGNGVCTGDGATWSETQGGVRWDSPGGDFSSDRVSTPATSRASAGWDAFDVKDLTLTRALRGEAPHLGLLLKKSDEAYQAGANFSYYSDDYSVAPSLRPKLEITYADGSDTPIRPTAAVGAPAPGATVSGTGGNRVVDLVAGVSDDGKVDRVEFVIDDAVVGTVTQQQFDAAGRPLPYSYAWPTSGIAAGTKTAKVRVTDDAGHVVTSPAVSFTLDHEAQVAPLIAPLEGAQVSGTVPLATRTGSYPDVTKVEFYADGTLVGSDSSAPYMASWNTRSASKPAYYGSHRLTTRAYDSSGLVGYSPPVNVTVDNSIHYGTKGSTASPSVPRAVVRNKRLRHDDEDPTFQPSALTAAPQDDVAPVSDGGREIVSGQPLETYPVTVTVTNATDQAWNSSHHRLWYRWVDPATRVVYEAPLPNSLNFPVGQTTVTAEVAAPSLPSWVESARYDLVFDVYHDPAGTESDAWLSQKGVAPAVNPVTITKNLSTRLGLEHFHFYDGAPVGAGMTHRVDVANGNSLLSWSAMLSPGRGLSTLVDLHYNALEEHSTSPVGNNFSMTVSSLVRLGEPLDLHRANQGANAMVRFTDGDGTTHTFTTDGAGGWVEPKGVNLYLRKLSDAGARAWAVTRPDGVTFYFDADGFPTSVEDLNGNTLTFELCSLEPNATTPCTDDGAVLGRDDDPGGPKKRVAAVTDAGGRSYAIDYYTKEETKDAQIRGNVERVSEHTGDSLSFVYYDDGNLKTLTQDGGFRADGSRLAPRSFEFRYTEPASSAMATNTAAQSSRLHSVTDPRGHATVFDYWLPSEDPDASQLRWKLESRTDREGKITSYSYDIATSRTTVEAPEGRSSKFAYDADGKVTTIERKASVTRWETTSLEWDADFNVKKLVEPSGELTSYTYNSNGYPTSLVNQQNHETTLRYEQSCAPPQGSPDPTCNHVSHLVTKTDPGTAAGPSVWSFDYFRPAYNLKSVTDPENGMTDYTWNANGTLATAQDANDNPPTEFLEYDANGLATRVRTPDGVETRVGFDPDGLMLWQQDPNHQSFSGGDPRDYRSYFYYDTFARLGATSMPKSSEYEYGARVWTTTTYDENDNVVSRSMPAYGKLFVAGPSSGGTYDDMDRPEETTNPEGHATKYVYDGAGRTTRVVRPEGVATAGQELDHVVDLGYDLLDRMTTQTRYENVAGAAVARTTTRCYENDTGDLVAVVPPKGAGSGCGSSFATRYTYFDDHTLRSVTDPEGHVVTHEYDPSDNVTKVVDAAGKETTYSYDRRNLRTKMVQPFVSDDPATTTVNETRRLTTVYEYDPVGNLVHLVSPRAFDTNPKQDYGDSDDYVTTHKYDAMNRLTRIRLPKDGGTEQAYVHRAYDANGNMRWTSLPVVNPLPTAVHSDAKTDMTYFDAGWIRTQDDAVNPTVYFDYTAAGWQATRVPRKPSGGLDDKHEMRWTYYPDGVLRARLDQEGAISRYVYDRDDNLTSAIDSGGVHSKDEKPVETTIAYDWMDRATETKHRKGSGAEADPYRIATTRYDANDNVVENVIDKVVEGPGSSPGRRSTFTYDRSDRLDAQVLYGDDASSCSDDRFVDVQWTATGWEKLRKIVRGSGTPSSGDCSLVSNFPEPRTKQVTTWGYHDNGKLRTLDTTDSAGALVESHVVSYVAAVDVGGATRSVYMNGHRTEDVFGLRGPANEATPCEPVASRPCTAAHDYDARDRLVEFHDGHGGTIAYTFDQPDDATRDFGVSPQSIKASNVTTEAHTNVNGMSKTVESSYTGTQLTSARTSSGGGSATSRYFYDPNGNLDCVTNSSGGPSGCSQSLDANANPNVLADYAYDGLDRLLSYRNFEGTNDSADYTYDALDRVVKESEHHGATSKITRFNYLG